MEMVGVNLLKSLDRIYTPGYIMNVFVDNKERKTWHYEGIVTWQLESVYIYPFYKAFFKNLDKKKVDRNLR